MEHIRCQCKAESTKKSTSTHICQNNLNTCYLCSFCLRCSSKNGNQEEYVDRNGIKVVVGHYVGPSLKQVPNATLAEINANNFHPEPKAGKDGRPVMTPPKDLFRMQKLFQINRFNLLASDRIALNRTLPDVRRKK